MCPKKYVVITGSLKSARFLPQEPPMKFASLLDREERPVPIVLEEGTVEPLIYGHSAASDDVPSATPPP
eukprot:1689888-Amphidinium_carterae.1